MIPFSPMFAVLQVFGLEGWELIAAGALALVAGIAVMYFVAFLMMALIFGKSWAAIMKHFGRF